MSDESDKYDIEENDIDMMRLKTLKMMILNGHEENARQHQELMEQVSKVLNQAIKTNGRVNALEDSTRFWRWFTIKPYRLAIFFLIPIIIMYMLSIENVVKFLTQLK